MSLDDLEDFEIFAGIAEEDQIASKREAANGRADVRTRASQFAGKRGELSTLRAQARHKILSEGNAPALLGDIGQDLRKIASNGCEEDGASQSPMPLALSSAACSASA